jgi:endoglucanase
MSFAQMRSGKRSSRRERRALAESLERKLLLAWTGENGFDPNTLALYHFNETSGTVADNAQGNAGRDLTLGSPSMVTSGVDFLGRTSNFLNMSFGQATSAAQAIPTDWTQGLTISFWMKTGSQSDGDRTPVWLSDGLGWKNEGGFAYHPTWTNPYRPKMRNVQTLYGDLSDINTRLLNGVWHHVAVTHRPSDNTARLYVDNVLMTSWADGGGTNLTAGAAVYIGQGFAGINAYVDELLIQKGELTNFADAYNAGGSNHPPQSFNDSYGTTPGTQLVVNAPGVLGNDTDQDPGETLTAIKVSDPAHGSVTLNSDGSFTYTPVAGWTGIDTFTYKAHDGDVDGNIAAVSINVNTPVSNGVSSVTSSTVTLNWQPVPGATAVRVYLAPEPAAGDLPDQVLKATLSGSATSYQVTGLAPDVDTFFRVEIDAPGGEQSFNTYARTKGGQLTQLDSNNVREVHAYGPRILQIVITDNINHGAGNDGATYQTLGNWSITRRNGTPIGIVRTSRFTRPINVHYNVGWGVGFADNENVDIDHEIFLELNQDIGSRDVLTINGPLGASFTLPFSDQYLETPVIRINQLGYNPRATERWAYLSGWMGASTNGGGGSLSLANFPATAQVLTQPADPMAQRPVALSGLAVTQRSASDPEAGGAVKQINLSALPVAEGVRYRVRIPGVGVSWPTAVSEEAVLKAFYTLVRGLYLNRWAGDLRLENTEWSRPIDHVHKPDSTPIVYTGEQQDWRIEPPATFNNPRYVIGGHHDAGDFDIRAGHTQIPQVLMRVYELNPSRFTDGQLHIPESGNGIPDLLDEALWNIRGWEALQEADGGVRAGLQMTHDTTSGYYYAHEEQDNYFTYARDPQVTARMSGVFAQAAYLLKTLDGNSTGHDDQRATELQNRAISAYNWASNINNRDFNGDSAAPAYMMYAAGELYRLTGSTTYKSAFESRWTTLSNQNGGNGPFLITDLGYMGNFTSSTEHFAMPDYLQGYLHGPAPDSNVVSVSASRLGAEANTALVQTDSHHAFRNSRPSNRAMDWGNGTTPNRFLDTVVNRWSMANLPGQALSPELQEDYFNALSLNADYILGGNPAGMVYISGLGSRHATDPLHLDTFAFMKDGKPQMPGIPEYGPVQEFPNAWYYMGSVNSFYPFSLNGSALPPALRFGDTKAFVNCSEFDSTMIQAPLAALFASLLGTNQTPPASYRPGGSEHINPLTSFGAPVNRAPVVEAGWKQTVTMPVNNLVLDGQMVDDGLSGQGATTTWSKVSGPGTVAFNNANALNATATFSAGGVYVLRLTGNDGLLSNSDTVTITVTDPSNPFFNSGFETGNLDGWTNVDNGAGLTVEPNTVGGQGNYVLHVNAGDWKYPVLSNSPQRLNGTQLINANYQLRFKAKFTAATGQSVIVNAVNNDHGPFGSTLTFTATDTNWRDYTLNFNSLANDKFYISFSHEAGGVRNYYLDDVVVTLTDNRGPGVNAGNDTSITLPASASLHGTVADDGRPNPPGVVTHTWSKMSGPGTVTFGNAGALDTTATFSQAGAYVLRLTASDSSVSDYDEVIIMVKPSSGGTGPMAVMGASTSPSVVGAGKHAASTFSTVRIRPSYRSDPRDRRRHDDAMPARAIVATDPGRDAEVDVLSPDDNVLERRRTERRHRYGPA